MTLLIKLGDWVVSSQFLELESRGRAYVQIIFFFLPCLLRSNLQTSVLVFALLVLSSCKATRRALLMSVEPPAYTIPSMDLKKLQLSLIVMWTSTAADPLKVITPAVRFADNLSQTSSIKTYSWESIIFT